MDGGALRGKMSRKVGVWLVHSVTCVQQLANGHCVGRLTVTPLSNASWDVVCPPDLEVRGGRVCQVPQLVGVEEAGEFLLGQNLKG